MSNKISKLNPDTCPQAINAIKNRIASGLAPVRGLDNSCVYQSIAYAVCDDGVWSMGFGEPKQNALVDFDFGFHEPDTYVPSPSGLILASSIHPKEEGAKPYRIILCDRALGSAFPEYVTHLQTTDDLGRHHGHYFSDLGQAIDNYCTRCASGRVHYQLAHEAERTHMNWLNNRQAMLEAANS